MKNAFAIAGLFFVAIIYGITNNLFRFIGSENYLSVVFFIMLFSTAILFLVLVLTNKINELKVLKEKKFLLLLGIFQALTWISIYFAVMNTMIANAVFGYITMPVLVVLLAPFILHEQINRKIILALVLALIGIILIFDPRNLVAMLVPLGIASGILAGFSYAMTNIIGRKLRDLYHPYVLCFFGFFIGALVLAPFFLVSNPAVPAVGSLGMILLIAVIGAVGYALIFYGLKKVMAQSASIILLLEPLVSIIAAFFIFAETPSILTLIGGALLLIADVVIIRNQ